jgi:Spy/CpxP family protein refolding chaperone
MKKYIATAVCSLILVSVSLAQRPMHPSKMKSQRVEAYKMELALTEAQLTQIKAIREEFHPQHNASDRSELTSEEKETLRAERREEMEKIQAVLTEEQRTKLKEIRKAEHQQRALKREQKETAPAPSSN